MKIKLPELSLVVLIGPSGCGKSTFAREKFAPFEVISSDFCRGLVANDENVLDANDDAFGVLHEVLRRRMKRGLLTVVDATNVTPTARRTYIAIAREFHILPVAIVFDVDKSICIERNRTRPDRVFGPHVILNQHRDMVRSLRGLEKEGFRHVFHVKTPEAASSAEIIREPLWNNCRQDHGPFDIIGDVHGCFDELVLLLDQLGYRVGDDLSIQPTTGRRLVFVGDLVDRGPRTPDVLRLVMRAVAEAKALCVPGNHDIKLMRALRGKQVNVSHGLQESLDQLAHETPEFRAEVVHFIDDLVSHYVFDDGKLVVAHAGLKEEMQGRGSGAVREFALYGETTGETDEFGLPVRENWAAEYRGKALVVYGHTPVPEPTLLNNTANIDTGCVFGGKLTAFRYPERATVSVPAAREYATPARPIHAAASPLSPQQLADDLLYMEDVSGRRPIETSLRARITIREENAGPALEIMTRFGVDPRWMVYLPPTMSPCETSKRDGILEHPDEAFAHFRSEGVARVVCEEKHMGSRAVVVLCRDAAAATRRFGIADGSVGTVYTRTGRPFFPKPDECTEFLRRLSAALDGAGAWDTLATDWMCLDAELMPWSAKALALLREQYAPVGAAGEAMLVEAHAALEAAAARGIAGADVALAEAGARLDGVRRYRAAYRRYCWPTEGIDGLCLAPFHILSTEAGAHTRASHEWHMETLRSIVTASESPLLRATPFRVVALDDAGACAEAAAWWTEITARGGEGMVVKPVDFIARGPKGLVQPALKVRGAEYLRIIYGPEYDRPANIERLRQRGLAHKRSMALREFALGIESLDRFMRREPLRRVHECVLGLLALETEPVDPRL